MKDVNKFFADFLDEYNQTWYDKDIKKLKEYYDVDGSNLIYYDNH